MSTPGSALVGYAILRANYNAQAPNYLDNFAPFVLAAIASSGSQVVKRDAVSGLIREMFGLNIPALVLPRLLRRAKKQGLTEPVGNDAIRLTARAASELPDLYAEVTQYRSRQAELTTQFRTFIENEFPEHLNLTTQDLGARLAEFFDKNAVVLLGASLAASEPVHEEPGGSDYLVASFVDKLYRTDQSRFAYVVEAAKGAMLASVLELDTSSMSESLSGLTLVLDTPVMMDALGYHGAAPESAISQVLQLAVAQGATLAIFRHSMSELEGVLEGIERALHRGKDPRSGRLGYLHFAEIGASAVDVALLRERLEDAVVERGISILDRPDGYREYGLDELKLGEKIQSSVRYFQHAARENDVLSLSAVHRMRRGSQSRTLERSKSVFVSSNVNLVRGAGEFDKGPAFPLAVTTEALASILWVRSPALADDVPREMVLASAYVGMQPSPILWKKYVDEIEKLEASGLVSADDAILLRATGAGRDALMAETLGDETAMSAEVPLAVLERVQDQIAEPYRGEVKKVEVKLSRAEARAQQSDEARLKEREARILAEEESREQGESLREREKHDHERVGRIKARSREIVHRRMAILTWIVRAILATALIWSMWVISSSPEFPFGSGSWIVAVVTVVGALSTFFGPVARWGERIEEGWVARRLKARLSELGYLPE